MSMLNGSMWKAHKLRIGPAKADWVAVYVPALPLLYVTSSPESPQTRC